MLEISGNSMLLKILVLVKKMGKGMAGNYTELNIYG